MSREVVVTRDDSEPLDVVCCACAADVDGDVTVSTCDVIPVSLATVDGVTWPLVTT